ncbi:MAG: chloride channel protein [Pseudomonadota bacterium]
MPGPVGRLFGFLYERIAPNMRGLWASRQPLAWLIALAVGVAAAYAILGFRYLILALHYPWLNTFAEHNVATLAAQQDWWLLLLVPCAGGLVVGYILHRFMPANRAEGVADVMEARAIGGAQMSLKTGLWSALVAALSLGTGASAGREGPAVHLGSTIATAIGSKFSLPPEKRRVILACGAAAAVSASFNAPIAGVLFAHEVILGHFAISAFVPTAIAAVGATIITRIHLGDFPAFIIPTYEITSLWEFPAFALLGITCGLVAVGFQFAVMAADWTARSITMPVWLRPALGGLMIGAIAIYVPEVLGVGYEATNRALSHQLTLATLFILLFAKTLATAITLASRFGGGVFSPSLYLGAMAGGAYGLMAGGVFPELASSEGLYAILGMGAVAAAVLGAPVSTVLIAFELTGGYQMTIALMLTVSLATVIMQAVHGQSFFHWQLSQRGLFLQAGPHKEVVRRHRVRDFMVELEGEEKEDPPEVNPDLPLLTPEDTLESALRAFDSGSYSRISVVSSADTSTIIGYATQMGALRTYNQALIASHEEEHR